MKKRSINILGHQTSISLEEEFWAEVKAIAEQRGLSLNKMITEIDRTRGTNKNLSSAIRLYVLNHLKNPTA
ncbi:MAG: ribbon-helix-helix domain-containing protein [Alphaproteobacteria bacterium]|nr:ribbon-helix-helix domain-containing protein [Alphaproteobacteria bacterium]